MSQSVIVLYLFLRLFAFLHEEACPLGRLPIAMTQRVREHFDSRSSNRTLTLTPPPRSAGQLHAIHIKGRVGRQRGALIKRLRAVDRIGYYLAAVKGMTGSCRSVAWLSLPGCGPVPDPPTRTYFMSSLGI